MSIINYEMDVNFAGINFFTLFINNLKFSFFVRLMNTIAPNSIPKINSGK